MDRPHIYTSMPSDRTRHLYSRAGSYEAKAEEVLLDEAPQREQPAAAAAEAAAPSTEVVEEKKEEEKPAEAAAPAAEPEKQ